MTNVSKFLGSNQNWQNITYFQILMNIKVNTFRELLNTLRGNLTELGYEAWLFLNGCLGKFLFSFSFFGQGFSFVLACYYSSLSSLRILSDEVIPRKYKLAILYSSRCGDILSPWFGHSSAASSSAADWTECQQQKHIDIPAVLKTNKQACITTFNISAESLSLLNIDNSLTWI